MEIQSGGDCCHVQPIDIDIDVEEKANETDCDIVGDWLMNKAKVDI